MSMLKEGERLFNMGYGVHWIRPKSKAPVKQGWSGHERDDWETLKREYKDGYGLGVRLGYPSALPGAGGGYAANVDVDVKSGEQADADEASALVEKHFPGLSKVAPAVETGYGMRFFCRTETPLQSGKLGQSAKRCKVLMPNEPANKATKAAVDEGFLTEAEVAAGYRIRPAWEVEFMSDGKQVVVPPSIHPDTGKLYSWVRSLREGAPLPLVKPKMAPVGKSGALKGKSKYEAFKPTNFDLFSSPLPDSTVALITTGLGKNGVPVDRSNCLHGVVQTMLDRGMGDEDIVTVLTDRDYALGETGFIHRSTSSRDVAADWVRRYVLNSGREKRKAASVFAKADAARAAKEGVSVDELDALFDDDAAALDELINGAGRPAATAKTRQKVAKPAPADDGDEDLFTEDTRTWQEKLEVNKHGKIMPTFGNVLAIVVNAISPVLIKRDVFANRDVFGADAPWSNGKAGEQVTDDSVLQLKHWLVETWHIEPSLNNVYEVCNALGVRNGFHPVKDELEALPKWDGKKRVRRWLVKHCGATSDPAHYVGDVFQNFMVASITRIYQPGAKYDDVPILEGVEGLKKSMLPELLFGEAYFLDHLPPLQDKDASLNLAGNRCVEFAELHSVKKNEVELVKSFISRKVDRVRPPYGRKLQNYPRQVVFIGTTNDEEYLIGRTGHRRFCPIKVGALDDVQLKADRDQLWAEALYMYRTGMVPKLYLEGESLDYARGVQREKIVTDTSDHMAEAIGQYFEAELARCEDEGVPFPFDLGAWKISDLFKDGRALGHYKPDTRHLTYAGTALRDDRLVKNGLVFTRRKVRGFFWWSLEVTKTN